MDLWNRLLLLPFKGDRVSALVLVLGMVTIIGTAVVGYQAYISSRDTLVKNFYDSNLALARTLRDASKARAGSASLQETLAYLRALWTKAEGQTQGRYLCVVNGLGKLILHTSRPHTVGKNLADHPLVQLQANGPRTMRQLLRSKKDWVGPYVSTAGEYQIAAFAYFDTIDSVIAVHVPYQLVTAQVRKTMLPWVTGILILGGVLFPLTLFILHRAYKASRQDLDLTHHELSLSHERLLQLAQYDELTGLINRSHFKERLQLEITRKKHANKKFALLFLDLDGFKDVNDSLGHDVGDQLLQAVTHRLGSRLRDIDTLARWGGDEFTIILDEIKDTRHVTKIAEELIDIVKPAYHLVDHEIVITTSIGIAIYPDNGEDIKTLLRNADSAMYLAKDKGKDTYALHTENPTKA